MLIESLMIMSMVSAAQQHVIGIAQGKLRGLPQNGYISYSGIPYAGINSSAGRFKKAGLAPIWTGIRESKHRHCSVYSNVEDCLTLDVHVPAAGDTPWPVLVWINGNSDQYDPGKLLQEGIIVVTVSHRTGPLGFICLNDEKIPGNAGIKDVLLALRWVRDNIVAFKGNPNKVVIGGQSFGAAIVEVLVMYPSAQNLYHGAIMQSGTILSPWVFNYDAKERATALKNMISDIEDTKSVLLSAKTEELVSKSDELDIPYIPFGACIETPFKTEEQLIDEPPIEMLKKKSKSVPLIIGYNTNEAYIFVSILDHLRVLRRITDDMSILLPEELIFLNEREVKQVTRQIREVYFKNNITMAAALAYHRDAYFVSHVHRSMRHHASSYHPVYYYQFSYAGGVGVRPEPTVKKTGAAHSDELAYLFPEAGRTLNGDDGVVQRHFVKMWTNFVKYLNPTAQPSGLLRWEPSKPFDPQVLDINVELQIKEFPYSDEARVWNEIYDKFYYSRQRGNVYKRSL